MAQLAKTGKTGYSQRNKSDIAAPLESDSDPEFNSGAFVPDEKKGKKKKEANPKSAIRIGGKRKRRSDVLDNIGGDGKVYQTGKLKPKPKPKSAGKEKTMDNPLLKWFGKDLDLHSASEDEEDNIPSDKDASVSDEEEKYEEEDDGYQSMLRSVFPEAKGGVTATKKRSSTQNDSATESESENDDVPPKTQMSPETIYLAPPNKLFKHNDQADDSATESDSDIASVKKQSTTESESDSDIPADRSQNPRPGFRLEPGQKYLGALVLDRNQRLMVPAAINTYLREYQRDGARFFWNQYKQGLGGLLGDDMGLGKTIQVISFLSAIMRKHGDERDINRRHDHVSELQDDERYQRGRILPPANIKWPTCLIIAPSTVVGNWEREFDTWGYFEVGIYNGPKEIRKHILKDFKMGRLDVVVTSFEIALRDIDLLDDLPWSLVIVDEVHRVKNSRSGTTRALHQFQSGVRFGLTGTAIQNNYTELWTILDWTNPKMLGSSAQWKGFVVHPLTVGQSVKAGEEQRIQAIKIAKILKDRVLPNFFKRRTKDIIKDQMPKKHDQVVFCPLTSIQIDVYKRMLATEAVQNLLHKDDPCHCGSKLRLKECHYQYDASDMLSYMSVLIKISNHLLLILPSPDDNPEQRRRHKELCNAAFPNNSVPMYGQVELNPQYCGKWHILEELLRDWRKDRSNKVLLFTKSIKLLTMLAFHVKNKSYGFLQLDGSVPMAARMPMIDEFHENPNIFIFLISTLAGGTGLNLTGANKVVIFDPNWNPAHDLQAMDRAYRFGQTRDVDVFRLLGAGSIEELIYARQLYKQQQMAIGYDASIQTRYFEGVQNDTSRQGELFGIKNIFKLHEGTLATKTAIEKANIAELDWAMAHMDSKASRKTGKKKGGEALFDTDIKVNKDDGDLRGLGSFLFDDINAPSTTGQQNEIQRNLDAIGAYTHLNNLQLLPTGVEEVRYDRASKKRRKSGHKKGAEGAGRPQSPEAVWPPKRKKHRAPPSPSTRLANRQEALIELGMINSPDHLGEFAQDFVRKPIEEQSKILRKLDDHADKNT